MPKSHEDESLARQTEPEALDREGDTALRQALIAGALVTQTALTVLASYYLGAWIDAALNTAPWFAFSLLGVGGVGAVVLLVRLVKKVERREW